ncbi:MAG: hypothetical protein KAX16_08180, partial [Actinomycetia bacterium]|nr:hypothetical protein [Actinomycetes bacterium]
MISEFRTHKITSLKLVLFLFIAALTVTFFMGKAHADEVFYVTPTGGTYNSIQDAINASSIGLDKVTIKVAEGRYHQSLNIGQAKDLTIQGGWNSTFTNRDTNRPTIVNGGDFGAGISINPGSTVVMDGLTVTHGSSSGLQINNSTVTVRKSKIGRNHNIYRGGGIFSSQSTLIVEDTLVSENSVVSGSLNTDATAGQGTLANGGGYGGGGIYASDTYLTVR